MPEEAGIAAILLGAGSSTRMNGVDKVVAPLLGRPLLAYSFERLRETPLVGRIVVVASQHNVDAVHAVTNHTPAGNMVDVCIGGPRRQDSVRAALDYIGDSPRLLVHDGARPLLSEALIRRAVRAASTHSAAVAAVPVKDTIKRANPAMVVLDTVPRQGLWSVQTPQVFDARLLQTAHRTVDEDVTDDAMMVEMLGHEVTIFMGDYQNLKVTTPDDLSVAEAILRSRMAQEDAS